MRSALVLSSSVVRLSVLVSASVLAHAVPAQAATSAGAMPSPMGGNGHNVTFDGRVFVVAHGDGWKLQVLRPERVGAGGPIADISDAFTPPVLIQPIESCENALAICEENADDVPFACDEAGNRSGGPFACYDTVVIDSNACGNGAPNDLRYRRLKVWIENPGTPDAAYHKHEWSGARTSLSSAQGQLFGIEPTITRDGKLLVWQGHPNNDGQIDILMYATNATPCAASGWSRGNVISHMVNDPAVRGTYRLAERTLRAADGQAFTDNQLVHGAYPWLFPDGSALNFTAVTVPCRAENDPAGCGPRRGGWSVLGYPTNWGVAHVDGAVNPDTDQTVRLFFSSPGPTTFAELPFASGIDVWPFFGSNTSNYTEIVFDDGLDGNYAGVWLMNESVNRNGELDRARTPDTSGYFNTGLVEGGAGFPLRNEGPRGKTLVFDGRGARVRVPNDVSLSPVNALTVEMTLRPDAPVDCDGNNNWRALLQKGGVGQGAFSLVFEEGETFQARVRAGGEQRSVWANTAIPVGQWSTIAFSYQAASGLLSFFVNGVETGTAQYAPAPLDATNDDLLIGSPGSATAACPDGNGGFFGQIEEVRLSRVDRFHAVVDPGEGEGEGDVVGEGEGEGDVVVGEGEGDGGEGEGDGGEGEGEGGIPLVPGEGEGEGDVGASCACATTSSPLTALPGLCALFALVARSTTRSNRSNRRRR